MTDARSIDVVLVEDSVADADLIAAYLEHEAVTPHRVRVAPTLRDARRELVAEPPDVVLLDLELPDSDGNALLRSIIEASGDVPIVVLTGRTDDEGQHWIGAGADDFLLKNELSSRTLHRSIAYALSRRHRRDLEDLRTRLESTGRMAASVAHEINNPVAIISGGIEMIGRRCELLRRELTKHPETPIMVRTLADELLGEINDVVARNLDCVERISVVVSSLDAFARPDSKQLEELDPNTVVEHAVRLAEHQTRWKTDVTLQLEAVPSLVGSRDRLVRTLVNLLINAGQATPAGQSSPNQVTIRTRHRGDSVVIDVNDKGVGIPEEVVPLVFDPFFTTRTDGRAAGLGLTVCRDIVLQHQGSIEVDSDPDFGTTVRITLPTNNGLQTAREALPTPAPVPFRADRTPRVLLIDDEPLLRSVTTQLLEPNFEVNTAQDGADALEKLAQDSEYDVVICDLMMPNMDGPSFFDAVGGVAPHIRQRLVFMTGGAFTPGAQEFLKQNMFAVLQKPFRREELLAAVQQQLATAGLFAEVAANSDAE